jgi:hypothetical protein
MVNSCNHTTKPFGFNPFDKDKEPTEEEIQKYKLWKCKCCRLWHSLISKVK